jgi:hypothetical protein
MKLTSKQLKRIIKEELNKIMNEAYGGMMPSSVFGGDEDSDRARAKTLAEAAVLDYTEKHSNLLEEVVEGVLWYFEEEGRDPTKEEIEELVDTYARF